MELWREPLDRLANGRLSYHYRRPCFERTLALYGHVRVKIGNFRKTNIVLNIVCSLKHFGQSIRRCNIGLSLHAHEHHFGQN